MLMLKLRFATWALAAMAGCGAVGLFGQSSTTKAAVIPSEVIIIGKNAITPATITRPAGQFVLYLENRSGLPNESYRLDIDGQAITAATAPLTTLSTQATKWADFTLVNLPSGTYRMTLQNQPGLSVQLVITK